MNYCHFMQQYQYINIFGIEQKNSRVIRNHAAVYKNTYYAKLASKNSVTCINQFLCILISCIQCFGFFKNGNS